MMKYLIAAIVILLIDAPWLWFQSTNYLNIFKKVQGGREPEYRLWPAIPVYAGLSYLLVTCESVQQAAATGLATYAVYDFTNLAVLKDYTTAIAVQDTIWGGVLFSLSFTVLKFLDL